MWCLSRYYRVIGMRHYSAVPARSSAPTVPALTCGAPRAVFLVLVCAFGLDAQTLNLSRDLVSTGAASANLQPNTAALDARPLFEAAIAYAGKNGITKLIADPGAYYFLSLHNSATHVLMSGASNLTVDWQNSDLYFKFSNNSAIQCTNCTSVTMQNFTLDYQQLPFTQVTVTSVDAAKQSFSYQTIPGYQAPTDFNDNRAGDGSDAIFMFVFRNGVPLREIGRLNGKRPFAGNTIAISNVNDPWAKSAQFAAVQSGDVVVLTDRSGPPTLNFVNGQDVVIRYASLYSSGQIGVYFGRTNRATADHVQVIPRPGTTRLISTNADGIHTSFALGANVFTNNIVRRTCDDALAISAPWIATITQATGLTVKVVRSFSSPFPPGASISFIDPAIATVLGSATIVSETPAFEQQKLTDGEVVILTLDQTVGGLSANLGVIDNDALKRGSGSVIAYNTVQDGVFARGIWFSGIQNASAHDNYVQRTSSNGIFIQQLSADLTDTGPSSNLTRQNNLVDNAIGYANVSHGVLLAAASIYAVAESDQNGGVIGSPHSNIKVIGNRVTSSARSAIRLENVNTGEITSNVIQSYGLSPSVNAYNAPTCCETLAQYQADFQQPVLTPHSTQVTLNGNTTADVNNLVVNVSTASGLPRLGVGSFAAAYGTNLATSFATASGSLQTTLAGVFVSVKDSAGVTRLAPVQYVSPLQVNYLVPDGSAPGIATVTIGSSTGALQIDAVGPGLYSINGDGKGVAAANAALYSADGTITPETVFQCPSGGACVAAPLDLGKTTDQLVITLYGTGLRNLSSQQNAVVGIGGVRAQILYVGAQPQYPGLDQVNLVVPRMLAGAGETPVVLTVDGQTANVVTLNIK